MSLKIVFYLMFSKIILASCDDVLILQPFSSISHRLIMIPIARELGLRGHQVTFVSTFSFEDSLTNVTEITYPQFIPHFQKQQNLWLEVIRTGFTPRVLKEYYPYHTELCRKFFDSRLLQNWMSEGKKYQIVMIDAAFHECLLPLWSFVGQNLVIINTGVLNPWVREYMRIPTPYSYVPLTILPYHQRMNFIQRLSNSMHWLAFSYVNYLSHTYFYEFVVEYFPDAKSYKESLQTISLVLLNHDPILVPPSPSLPTVISIGGIQCQPALPLPDGQLRDFVDSSDDNGFILISFGSIINGNFMEMKLINKFISAFSQIKQKVVWKYESELSNLSSNVMISNWVPQQDLLGHPKIRAFISLGGLQSMQEAIYHKVPQISFPLTSDQPLLVAITSSLGITIKMNMNTMTEEELIQAIDKASNDKEMRKAVEYYSQIFRDRDEDPLDKAIYWLEYVMRYNGTLHLQTPAGTFNFVQYYLLDVSAFIGITLISILFLFWFGFKLLVKTLVPYDINYRCLLLKFKSE